MTEGALLDLILIGIFVVFLLIGLWRGAVRSVMEMAGIFLASEMVLWWSSSIADRLTDIGDVELSRATFAASFLLLVLISLGIGAVSGNLLASPARVRRDKIFGAAFGLANGVLFSALVIRYYQLSLAPGDANALSDTRVADFLWDRYDYVLLAIVVGEFSLLVLNWVLFPDEVLDQARTAAQGSRTPGTTFATSQPEPAQSSDFLAGTNASQQMPEPATPKEDVLFGPPPAKPSSAGEHVGAPSSAIRSPESEQPESRNAQTVQAEPLAEFDGYPEMSDLRYCTSCGIRLDTDDQFCPDCGAGIAPVR